MTIFLIGLQNYVPKFLNKQQHSTMLPPHSYYPSRRETGRIDELMSSMRIRETKARVPTSAADNTLITDTSLPVERDVRDRIDKNPKLEDPPSWSAELSKPGTNSTLEAAGAEGETHMVKMERVRTGCLGKLRPLVSTIDPS